MCIEFYFEKKEYRIFDTKKIKHWLKEVICNEELVTGEITYQIVNDVKVLEINKEFLNHNYHTDIITFDESFINIINGSIFISFDTVKYNAENMGISVRKELYRVIVHGIMHLCGYNDESDTDKCEMRKKEDYYLSYLEEL